MAAKVITLPNGRAAIPVSEISDVQAFTRGIGIFNNRGRMIGWIECDDESTSIAIIADFAEMINDPRRSKQPDWSKYFEDTAADGDDVQVG